MAYKIKIDYQTGDSFDTYDTSTLLDGEWNNLEVAKENLKRIQLHYEFFLCRSNRKTLLKLKTDDGVEYKFYPFWCGYFEKLYGAEIIVEGMKFTVGERK